MNDFNDPSSDPINYKFGMFYYNKNDYRTVVPKRNKLLGWTLNFAKPASYFFLLVLIAVVVFAMNN